MSDQLPGGAPAFEEPDFSQFEGEEDSAELDDVEEYDEEEEGDELAVPLEEDDEVTSVEPEAAAAVATESADANTSEGGSARAVLEHLAKSIVDDKEAVVIEARRERGQLRLYLHVASSDMGRIIGRRGRTAQAVRTLVRAAAAAENDDVFVEIVD